MGLAGFLKLDPADWRRATRHLSPEHRGALLDVMCEIAITGRAINDDEDTLSALWGVRRDKARRLRKQLLEAGVLQCEIGVIFNKRALIEVNSRLAARKSKSEAGRKGGKSSSRKGVPNKTKVLGDPVNGFAYSGKKAHAYSESKHPSQEESLLRERDSRSLSLVRDESAYPENEPLPLTNGAATGHERIGADNLAWMARRIKAGQAPKCRAWDNNPRQAGRVLLDLRYVDADELKAVGVILEQPQAIGE